MIEALSLKGVAERLGVSDRQVRRWVTDARDPLPTIKLGPRCRRVDVGELAAWIARRRELRRVVEPGLFAGFSDDARATLEGLFGGSTAPEVHRSAARGGLSPCPSTADPLITTQQS